MKKLNNICIKFKLGNISSYAKQDSSQNNVYKVNTEKGIYIIKEYTKDAVGNYYYLNKRKEQLKVIEKLKDSGINCLCTV